MTLEGGLSATEKKDLNQYNAKILYYHYTREAYWPLPYFSEQMVFVGPNLDKNSKNMGQEGSFVKGRINVGTGPVDLNPILEKVSDIFEPDILICWYNPLGDKLINTDCFKGIKVMIAGDCHHMFRPIESHIHYIEQEKFDFVINGDRRMVQIFEDIIPSRNFWLPGNLAFPKFIAPLKNPLKKIVHVGQTSNIHINRYLYLQNFKSYGLPIDNIQLDQKEIHDVYNRYAITLNISLNGDINARWYHVPSAGGVLIANELSKTTGFRKLYSNDEIPTFASPTEGCSLLKRFLKDDELRYETALKAQKRYKETFSRYLVLKQFFNIINSKEIDPFFLQPYSDESSVMKLYDKSLNWDNLIVYQTILECFRISASVKVDIEGWNIDSFTYLKDFKQIDVNYLTERTKKLQLQDIHDVPYFDAKILVTNKNITSENIFEKNHSYDLILHKFQNEKSVLNGYKLIKINQSFNLYKKSIDFRPKKPDIYRNPLSSVHTLESEYQKNFLTKKIPINPEFSNQEILMIGGSMETFNWLKKIYQNSEFLNISDVKKLPFFEDAQKVYDLIIFFDDSNDISELSKRLGIIFGLMKLSARLVFHSGQFVLGPYGWIKNYFPREQRHFERNNPWSHLEKVFKYFGNKGFTPELFEKKLLDLLHQQQYKNPRSVDYNAKLIQREFGEKGYSIIKREIISHSQKCPFELNINSFSIDLNSSAIIMSVEKYNSLEVNIH